MGVLLQYISYYILCILEPVQAEVWSPSCMLQRS